MDYSKETQKERASVRMREKERVREKVGEMDKDTQIAVGQDRREKQGTTRGLGTVGKRN